MNYIDTYSLYKQAKLESSERAGLQTVFNIPRFTNFGAGAGANEILEPLSDKLRSWYDTFDLYGGGIYPSSNTSSEIARAERAKKNVV